MASTAVELVIALVAKDAASAALGEVGKKLDSLGKAGQAAKVGLGIAATGIGLAVTAGLDFVKAAADEQVAIERMAQSVRNAGGDWEKLGGPIEDTIAKLQRTSTFVDEDLRQAFSMLTAETGDVDEAMRRLPIAMDLAAGAGLDVVTAGKLLGKVTDENANVLKRYGVIVEKGADSTEVLAAVQQKFGGQSAVLAGTAVGQWAVFTNQIDALKESLGGALLPVATKVLGMLTSGMDALSSWVSSSQVQAVFEAIATAIGNVITVLGEMFGVLSGSAPAAGGFLKSLVGEEAANGIMQFVATIRQVISAVMEMFGVITGMAPNAGAALTALVGPEYAAYLMSVLALIRDAFKMVFEVIGGIITGFKTGNWDALGKAIADGVANIGTHLGNMVKNAVKFIGDLIVKVVEATPAILEQLGKWALQFVQWVADSMPKMLTKLGELLGQLLAWIGENAPGILAKLGEWAAKFGEFIVTDAIPKFLEYAPQFVVALLGWIGGLIGQVGGALGDFGWDIISAIGDGIRNAASNLWNAVTSALRNAFSGIDFWIGPFHITSWGITISLPEIHFPGFQSGTPYVPETGLALIHKGEAIIPADRNPFVGNARASEPSAVDVHEIHIYLDGNDISQSVQTVQRRTQRRTGTTLEPSAI